MFYISISLEYIFNSHNFSRLIINLGCARATQKTKTHTVISRESAPAYPKGGAWPGDYGNYIYKRGYVLRISFKNESTQYDLSYYNSVKYYSSSTPTILLKRLVALRRLEFRQFLQIILIYKTLLYHIMLQFKMEHALQVPRLNLSLCSGEQNTLKWKSNYTVKRSVFQREGT